MVSGRAHGPPPDLRVRRCTVRVRRRDGWAWGDPGDLVPEVLDGVEAALAELVTQVGTVEGDVRVTAPVRLSLRTSWTGRPVVGGVDELVARVREQVDRSEVAQGPGAPQSPAPEARTVVTPSPADAQARTRTWAALASVLARWSRDGRLAGVVATWPSEVREAWVTALAEAACDPGATQTWSFAALTSIAQRVLATEETGQSSSDARVRMLVVVGALAAAARDRLPDAEALEVVRRVVGRSAVATPTAGPPVTRSSDQAIPVAAAALEPTDDTAAYSSQPVTLPALPFLVVVQLHRLAYLAPAAAALAVGGLADAERVLAGLVAGKALPPPAHGWRRSDAEATTVSLVAGMPAARLAERVGAAPWTADDLAPLTAVLAGLYADDPDPDGLVLTRLEDDTWICGEAGGLPIGWGSGPAGLTSLLDQLAADEPVVADLFADLADRLQSRRAAPGLLAEDLERHLGAVVGAALGSLAAELWGPLAGPLTALDRLSDLEGRVVVGPGGLVLALPRGQRWLDLRRAGLLETWSLPWAPGGRWELVTW